MPKSILQSEERKCFFTGSRAVEKHHVMNGSAYRWKAEKYGLWIYISKPTHDWIHNKPGGRKFAYHLKAYAQHEFEKHHPHELWMKEFKKDYSEYFYEDISYLYRHWRE